LEPVKSAYNDKIEIDDKNAAVTILAYRTGWHIGGHTHLAFEYPDSKGYSGTAYRHVVFHLVAMGGGCDQSGSGTKAGVLKQVPVTGGRYGFVGDKSAYKKAQKKAKKGQQLPPEKSYKLLPVGNWDRNLPNDTSWTTKKYRSRTVQVKPTVAKSGHLLCRKMAKGVKVEGIESSRFHKFLWTGTNCAQFAFQVLKNLGIEPDSTMEFHVLTSPPEAIKRGRLIHGGKKW
jgi:hypothetical protein